MLFFQNLSEKISTLDFGDDDSTEDILELAGTLVKYLEVLLSRIDKNEDSDKLNSGENYAEVMSPYGLERATPTNSQIQVSVDNFLSPFKDIFNKIGIIYESYDTHINEPFNEDDIINNYKTLNFKEIQSLLKLYEDGQLS